MMYRQGDVFVKKIGEVDLTNAKEVERENGAIVLAHGEATGHRHAIKSPHANLFDIGGNERVLIVKREVKLEHEEHKTIPFPPGIYKVKRQREYHPEKIRYVAD